MKQILYVVVPLLIIVGVWLLFIAPTEKVVTLDPLSNENLAITGVVVAVDLDQMAFDGPALIVIQNDDGEEHTIAVPSMGLLLCAAYNTITPVNLIMAGDRVKVFGNRDDSGNIVPCEGAAHYLEVISTQTHETLGYQFIYKKGPDGYLVLSDAEAHGSHFITGSVLFNRAEYEELLRSTDAREGPPAIHIQVYENADKLSAPIWAMRNPQESNAGLRIGESEEAVVGGANAEFYVVDGLWPTDTYVVANSGYIFVLMGSYKDTGDAIYKDFHKLVDSFTFIPPIEVPADVKAQLDEKSDLIVVDEPMPLQGVQSPILVSGIARGMWFFEASFPITVTDWDGRIIGEGFATAAGEWMTEDFVPFTGRVTFDVPPDTPYDQGAVIFHKDNPSGLQEHDDALEIPVQFEELRL